MIYSEYLILIRSVPIFGLIVLFLVKLNYNLFAYMCRLLSIPVNVIQVTVHAGKCTAGKCPRRQMSMPVTVRQANVCRQVSAGKCAPAYVRVRLRTVLHQN